MRLVSHHGNVDIPYENAQIFCEMEYVLARVGKYEYTLGKYSGESKSKKVMEMVRDAYCGLPVIFQNVDVSENVKEMFSALKKNGIILRTEDFKEKQEIEYVNNVVFQFPKDEEVDI